MKGVQVLLFACMAATSFAQEITTTTEASGNGTTATNTRFGAIPPGVIVDVPASQTCRYWCRTPQGQAYCCEGNDVPQGPVGVKPGFCPPVRPNCPPVRNFLPPQSCSNDYSCAGVDKCCFDTCLEEHVCKPPQGSVGFPS